MKIALWSLVFLGLSQNFAIADNKYQIEALKKQVVELSWENISNEANRAEVRAKLEGLLADLEKLKPAVTEGDIARFSPGSWQQIWSDEMMMDPPGAPARDFAQIYQVVNVAGWGYNFGVRKINEQDRVTFALAVVASVSGNQQTTEITKAFMRPSGLVAGESLAEMAMAIQEGRSSDFQERNAGRFPRGPIGAKGVLTIRFIDEDLKIGITPNVYNGKLEMFVMQRTAAVR